VTQPQAERAVLVTHDVGLHARPSVKLTKLAKKFDATIRLRTETDVNGWIDAKSIVKVMALKIAAGETLVIQAEGSDADAAIDALAGLVERDFDEARADG
jgi:phosphocarrier protein